MNTFRARRSWIVFLAILLLFAACKGETPTAPPPGGGTPPGGTTPPTGVSLTLAVSSQNPVVDSSVTITATVTQNGQPVPNGTAVEFTSTGGVLNGGGTSAVKTTTNGVATVTLTSGTAGTVRVTATVGNVVRETAVNFQARPIVPQPPNTNPTITSVSPSIGRPTGGQTIRITGTNFRPPLRVLFRYPGLITPVEAFVVASTETTIDVITPAVNLGAGQQLVADIIVITQAGTAAENRAEATGAFTFRNEQLTPNISTVTPASGPITGGTRVTIIGEGFQEPVQVLFGFSDVPSWQEAQVVSVKFNEIIAVTPPGSSTSPGGSGPITGPVDVRVVNINSDRDVVADNVFRYVAAMIITAVGPTEGPVTGGTRVTIDGQGFVAPVAVTIAGVAAQPIFVSGTRIIAITSPVEVDGCADVSGPVTVVNITNGDGAEGPAFTYEVDEPVILSVSPTAPGGTVTVRVANVIGIPRLRIGDTTLSITSVVDNGDGTFTFTATVPTTITLNTQACPAIPGASRPVPTAFNVVFTDLTTGCEDTVTGGATLAPPANTPTLTIVPAAFGPFSAVITPASAGPPPTPATVAPSAPQTITATNTGTGTLTVNSVTPTGAGCAFFDISTPSTPSLLQPCDPFPITAVYSGSTAPATHQCTLTISTDAGVRTVNLTGRSQ